MFYVDKFEENDWWNMKMFCNERDAKEFKKAYEDKHNSYPYSTYPTLRIFEVKF